VSVSNHLIYSVVECKRHPGKAKITAKLGVFFGAEYYSSV